MDEFKKAGCDMSIRNQKNVTVLEAVSKIGHLTEKELCCVCLKTVKGSSLISSLL